MAFTTMCPFLVFSIFAMLVAIAAGMPAFPAAFTDVQFDGTPVTLFVRGDEHHNWLEDSNGFIVMHETVQTTATAAAGVAPLLAAGVQSAAAPAMAAAQPALAGVAAPQRALSRYTYAAVDAQGQLAPTSFTVGQVAPFGIPGLAHESVSPVGMTAHRRSASEKSTTSRRKARQTQRPLPPTKGTITNLVVMIRWADDATRNDLPTVAQLDAVFNGNSNNTNNTRSLRDHISTSSYGQLTINSVFSDWITVSQTHAQAAQGNSGLGCCVLQTALNYALQVADGSIDFTNLDANNDGAVDLVTFVHSGYAAEWGRADVNGLGVQDRIWSHQTSFANGPFVSATGKVVFAYSIASALWGTSGNEAAHMGVLTHELMHQFGLPDLYDPDVEGWGVGSGLASYCLMSNSWGYSFDQNFPPLVSPYLKIQLGWVQPTIISAAGIYTANSAASSNTVYKITQGYPDGEYLLIENRQNAGYDSNLPSGGLAIYHIDERTQRLDLQSAPASRLSPTSPAGLNMWPWNHYRVALVQADGQFHLEASRSRGDAGDLFRIGGVTTIGPSTVPDTNTYQNGVVRSTGLTINVLSPSSTTMQFSVSWAATPTPTPIPTPTGSAGVNTIRTPAPVAPQANPSGSFVQPSPCEGAPTAIPTTLTTSTTVPTSSVIPTPVTTRPAAPRVSTTSATPSAASTTAFTRPSSTMQPSVARPTSTTSFSSARPTPTPSATATPAPSRLRLGAKVAVSQPKAPTNRLRGQASLRVLSFGATTTGSNTRVSTVGANASGVRVNGRFERVNLATGSVIYREYVAGNTNKSGSVTLQTTGSWVATAGTSVQFCLVSVAKAGAVQDLSANDRVCVRAA